MPRRMSVSGLRSVNARPRPSPGEDALRPSPHPARKASTVTTGPLSPTDTSRREDERRRRVAALVVHGRQALAELDRVTVQLGAVMLAELAAS